MHIDTQFGADKYCDDEDNNTLLNIPTTIDERCENDRICRSRFATKEFNLLCSEISSIISNKLLPLVRKLKEKKKQAKEICKKSACYLLFVCRKINFIKCLEAQNILLNNNNSQEFFF